MNDIFVSDNNSLVREVLAAYDLPETLMGAVRYGQGHINDTYCVVCQPQEGECKRFLLQGLSLAAFPRQAELMENYVGITSYLKEQIQKQGGDPERETLGLIMTSPSTWMTAEKHGVWFPSLKTPSAIRLLPRSFLKLPQRLLVSSSTCSGIMMPAPSMRPS